MSSVNRVILVGNVGKDPQISRARSGDLVVNFSIATTKKWKAKSGERQEVTHWHRIVIFDQKKAEVAEKYIKKGSKVYIEGELAYRKYTKDGEERTATEIIMNPFQSELQLLDRAEKHERSEEDFVSSGSAEPPKEHDEIPF